MGMQSWEFGDLLDKVTYINGPVHQGLPVHYSFYLFNIFQFLSHLSTVKAPSKAANNNNNIA